MTVRNIHPIKTINQIYYTMKQIEKIAQGANYAAINVGRISEIIEH